MQIIFCDFYAVTDPSANSHADQLLKPKLDPAADDFSPRNFFVFANSIFAFRKIRFCSF
jgi:hypothetical protein